MSDAVDMVDDDADDVDDEIELCLQGVVDVDERDTFDSEFKASLGSIEQVRFAEEEKVAEEKEKYEREARLGPAGLDPFEVIESLPPKLREAFETQNTLLLKAEFAALPQGVRQETYARVVGSGLWMPAVRDDDDTDSDRKSVV